MLCTMKTRLVRYYGKLRLLYADGTFEAADDSILKMLFVGYMGADRFGKGKAGRWDTEHKSMEDAPGKTLAWVDDEYRLIIIENVFVPLVQSVAEEDYVTVQEYAVAHGLCDSRVKVLCREGRLAGAVRKGNRWFIPRSSELPKDARFSGVEK